MSLRRRLGVAGVALLPFVLALLVVAAVLFERQGGFAPFRVPRGGPRDAAQDAATIRRGEYLAHLGNCAVCHTTRGGPAFTGGRPFTTDYGIIHSTNLTPDVETGIGDWSLPEFAHVLRNGVSRHGVLYPVFPYAHFASLKDDDIAAIYAYLRSLTPVRAPTPQNALDFPENWRPILIGWRMLYYRPDEMLAAKPDDRGRYLVDGLGHCAMCHSRRGNFGSLPREGYLAGGSLPVTNWYAPPLDSAQLQRYSVDELARFLRAGSSDAADAYGPMAEVIYGGLHFITDDDARAIATHLKRLPPHPPTKDASGLVQNDSVDGGEIYRRACADCHGAQGEGKAGKYPALRGTVAMTAPDPINALRLVLYGGLPPATERNPRPYSMPPFVYQLSAAEIAAVVNYTRHEFGDRKPTLSARDVETHEGIVIE
ncbi:MAG TPA: cytochrome c [Rudaea sp.]